MPKTATVFASILSLLCGFLTTTAQSAVETVTPMLDKDGQWRVSGHYIR